MFWSSEDRVKARFHYAESRQNKPQVNLWRKSCLRYGLWPEIIIFNQNPCITKKTGEKFGGYRLYSYICKCNNNKKLIHIRLNLDEAVCEYRLIFLYNHRILDGCFLGDRIGDARHLNENLEKNLQLESLQSVCSVDFFQLPAARKVLI